MKSLVSVLIPCFNRADSLAVVLEKIACQSYPNVEVIVVDDCSPTDDVRAAASSFEFVQYVRTPTNRGLIAARNYGEQLCNGEYVLNLDDDSWPLDDTLIAQAVAHFEHDPKIAILALNITLRGRSVEFSGEAAFETSRYVGCGNLHRRSLMRKVGPYTEELYRQGEEVDRAYRVIDAGYKILACPDLFVYHDYSPINRDIRRHRILDAANYLRWELMRAPLPLLPIALMRSTLSAIWWLKYSEVKDFYEEIVHPNRSLKIFLRLRKAVRIKSYLRWHLLDIKRRLQHR